MRYFLQVDSYNDARSLRQIEKYQPYLVSASSSSMQHDDVNIICIDDEIDELKSQIERWKTGLDVSPDGIGFEPVSTPTQTSCAGQRKIHSSLNRTLNW